MIESDEAEVLAWLGASAERHIETACAHVFLSGPLAYKLKRHVDLGYVNFSTAEQRRWALDRELAFNRPAAPDIYRAVRRITREPDGALAMDGRGGTVDWLLEMRRFDEDAVLAKDPAVIDGALADALGRAIAGFHADAPLRPEGGWSAMDWTVASNARLLRELSEPLGGEAVERLIALTAAELARQRPLLEARTAAGFSRRCHGDLHLGNILLENGAPVLFDCLEFSDLLCDLDVQYDLAFLLMDLDFRGRRDAGVRVLSAYLDAAARRFPVEIWEGLAALPLMMSVRAAVRAHVLAHTDDAETGRAYVAAGIAHLAPPPPRLVAVGGYSGTGKSTFAWGIAPHIGASPGAVVLRTDEVRKRLADLGPTERAGAGTYEPAARRRVYDVALEEARALLSSGHSVVLDATFLDPEARERARRLATACGVAFQGVWLEAPAEILERRLAGRIHDASDATAQVLRDQLARGSGAVDWARLDVSGPAQAVVGGWLERDAT